MGELQFGVFLLLTIRTKLTFPLCSSFLRIKPCAQSFTGQGWGLGRLTFPQDTQKAEPPKRGNQFLQTKNAQVVTKSSSRTNNKGNQGLITPRAVRTSKVSDICCPRFIAFILFIRLLPLLLTRQEANAKPDQGRNNIHIHPMQNWSLRENFNSVIRRNLRILHSLARSLPPLAPQQGIKKLQPKVALVGRRARGLIIQTIFFLRYHVRYHPNRLGLGVLSVRIQTVGKAKPRQWQWHQHWQ